MEVIQGSLLGILQGVAEWLPISSQGILMLTMIGWFGISPLDALSYSIFLHLGTMMAVLIRFRHEFVVMIDDMSSLPSRTVVISSLCTGITGIPLYLLLKDSFGGGKEAMMLIGLLLVVTGLHLRIRGSGSRDARDLTFQDMVVLGLAQGFSILPGISRSGTTLTVLLIKGIRQEDALNISFIISVPAVLGAIVLNGWPGYVPWESALAMIGSSFLVGYLTMDLLLRFARNASFSIFCLVLGLVAIISAIGWRNQLI
jgi:undecaprenyl-diphosphatase